MTTQSIDRSEMAAQKGDPYSRAMTAYFKQCQEQGVFFQQPANYSGVRQYDGREYVVLENIHGPLAVYLIGADGELEDVDDYTKWPAALREQYPDTWLAAWALTEKEAIGSAPGGPIGEMYIRREGANDPEACLESFGGDLGPDKYHFDEEAADALLESNGYRRTSPWHSGSMNGRPAYANSITEGRSCEIEKVRDLVTEAKLHDAALELIDGTPGAETLNDVGRIRNRDWTELLAEESGIPLERVRAITGPASDSKPLGSVLDEDELMDAAREAYHGDYTDEPANTSGVRVAPNGEAFAVFENANGVLAVYRESADCKVEEVPVHQVQADTNSRLDTAEKALAAKGYFLVGQWDGIANEAVKLARAA